MITARPQNEKSFIFYVTPRLIVAHGSPECIEEMKEAVRHTACWLSLRAFKDILAEFKKTEEAEESLVIILNLADAGVNKIKEIFFNEENLANLANMEEKGRISIVVNKKQFFHTIPPYEFSLKQKIIAQQGVPVLVIDYGTIEIFSV